MDQRTQAPTPSGSKPQKPQRPPLPRFAPFRPPPSARPRVVQLKYADVCPGQDYANDVKAGLRSIDAALGVFDRMRVVMDQQPKEMLGYNRVRTIDSIVRALQDTGRQAAEHAGALALRYQQFATRQAARLAAAPRAGWRRRRRIERDSQLETLGGEMRGLTRKLATCADTLVSRLTELGAQIKALQKLRDDIARWQAIIGFLSVLLKVLAALCSLTGIILYTTPAAEAAELVEKAAGSLAAGADWLEKMKLDEAGAVDFPPEEVERNVAILTKAFPSLLQSACKQLDRHTHCVERLLGQVDGVQGGRYISRGDAMRAEREWVAEAKSLSRLKQPVSAA
ncbi:hypothetical protein CALVIDRAFT_537891 [Calocera viscosa TUFC12733]|uniref:Uncharacterized protein n=1 Tax=Calocera viscosa (strain TUFC12733) TaxID=1330018 RepID=A0A167LBA7_CALVF|nr:hypothetical protein CALVIDRAFT_537891 [Calocera viscosa TUFC12733]